MEPLSLLKTREKTTVTRLNKNSKIFKTIIQAILDKKGENIISLDLRKIPEASADWVLIDYINVVVHVMHPEARNFYKLEEMWSDAVSQMHES